MGLIKHRTFVRAWHDFVLHISVFEYTFRAKHFIVIFAVEFDLFIFVNITGRDDWFPSGSASRSR